MTAGRPTKYDPKYCDEIIDYMGQGYSKTAFAGHIGVSRETIYEWGRTHEEFSDATKRAEAARTGDLESRLLDPSRGTPVAAAIFALKNAAPEEWRDKREVEHSGEVKGAFLWGQRVDDGD